MLPLHVHTPRPSVSSSLLEYHDNYNVTLLPVIPFWAAHKNQALAYFRANPPKQKGDSETIQNLKKLIHPLPIVALDNLQFQWSQLMFSDDKNDLEHLRKLIQNSCKNPPIIKPRGNAPKGTTDCWVRPHGLVTSFNIKKWINNVHIKPGGNTIFSLTAQDFFQRDVLPHSQLANPPFSKLHEIIPYAIEKHNAQHSFSAYLLPWNESHRSETWAHTLIQTNTPIIVLQTPLYYINEHSGQTEGASKFKTAIAFVGMTLLDNTLQEFELHNCPRGHFLPPPDDWFKHLQVPGVQAPQIPICKLLKLTAKKLMQLIDSNQFQPTKLTHLLALEKPLAANYYITQHKKYPIDCMLPEIKHDPNRKRYTQRIVLSRKEWQTKPHPLETFFPSQKHTRCETCGNMGHQTQNCIRTLMTPEEMGLTTELHKCLYHMLQQLKPQSQLPHCTTADYASKVLPELNRRAKIFRQKWKQTVQEWSEPIPNADDLFNQCQQLGALHNSLDFLYARGATKWEIERAAFGVRSFQRHNLIPSIECCDYKRNGRPCYYPLSPELEKVDKLELQRGNLKIVDKENIKFPITRFMLLKPGSTTEYREISDGSAFTQVHEKFPYQMHSIDDIFDYFGPDAVVFLLDVFKAFKNIQILPRDIYNWGFKVSIDGQEFWVASTVMLFGVQMSPSNFCSMLHNLVNRIAPCFDYSDDLNFKLAISFGTGEAVARNCTNILQELTRVGIPINSKICVATSPIHVLGLIINLKTHRIVPQASSMAKLFLLILQICESKTMNYHELEKLISLARWVLQSKDRHMFQRLYNLNTQAAKKHQLRPQDSTRERKQVPVELTRDFYLVLVKIFHLLIENFKLFETLPVEHSEFALTVVTDANRAMGVGHVYSELHQEPRILHTSLPLQHEITMPNTTTAIKFSGTDEAETLFQTLQSCADVEKLPRNAALNVLGDNEGVQVLLQKRKPSRNLFLTKILDKIHLLTDQHEWRMTYTWMTRAHHLIKKADQDGRLPPFLPQRKFLQRIEQDFNVEIYCPNIIEQLPQWPSFPIPAWWDMFLPTEDTTIVLFLLPPQLTNQAIDFIAHTFTTCPYRALLGLPITRKYRLTKIFSKSYKSYSIVPRNFQQLHKTHHVKYAIGQPHQPRLL